MARNYESGAPMRNNGAEIYAESPAPYRALARFTSENATVSSVISLTHDTTAVEVATGGTSAAMRWVTTGDTQASIVTIAGSTSNFDYVIPATTVRRFVVPIEAINNAQGYGSAVGANRANGLFQRIAWRTHGIGSVALTEYGSSNSY